MVTTIAQHEKREALRKRFGLSNGCIRTPYRCKNQNIYLVEADGTKFWLAFSDIDEHDVKRIQAELHPGEEIETGWKDMQPNEFHDDFFEDGGGVWVRITSTEVDWVLHGSMPTGSW